MAVVHNQSLPIPKISSDCRPNVFSASTAQSADSVAEEVDASSSLQSSVLWKYLMLNK